MTRTDKAVTFRNIYSGATFKVHGEEAAERMAASHGWVAE